MRTTKGVFIFLLLVAMILTITQLAMADRGKEGAGSFLDTIMNPSARGTIIAGPIAIYYEKIGSVGSSCCPGANDFLTNMRFFMRLTKGKTTYSFSGIKKEVCYFDEEKQASAIKSFIENTVIPVIYGTGATYPFAIKNISHFVEDNESSFPGCCGGWANTIYFTIADIEIAVQN